MSDLPIFLDILQATFAICAFQLRFSSISTPKNLVTGSLVICVSSTFKTGSSFGKKRFFFGG